MDKRGRVYKGFCIATYRFEQASGGPPVPSSLKRAFGADISYEDLRWKVPPHTTEQEAADQARWIIDNYLTNPNAFMRPPRQ